MNASGQGLIADEMVAAIRKHMAEHAIRVQDVADSLGVTPSYVSNVLHHHPSAPGARFSVHAAQRILDVLGLSVRIELMDR